MFCPYGNKVNFSHTSRIHFSTNNTSFCPFKRMGAQLPKNPRNSPFPSGTWTPSNTSMPGPTPITPKMTARSLYALPHNYATNASLVTIGRPKFNPKTAPSLRRSPPPSNTPIPWPTHPKRHPDPISRFARIHFAADRQTDRDTDRWSRRMLPWARRSLCW